MLHRRPLVKALLADRPQNLLAVSSLGTPTWDLVAAGKHPLNFYVNGTMGQAGPFALGLAMAQPNRRILLIAGDGEVLMGLGALATIANQAPANLAIVVLDDEAYLATGIQPTATAGPTDLEAVARGCGFATTCTVTTDAQVDSLRDMAFNARGPALANVKVVAEALPMVLPETFDGVTALNEFRDAVVE